MQQEVKFNEFKSQTFGDLNFDSVIEKLEKYMVDEPGLSYELIIGTDSIAIPGNEAEFVSAIVVHRKFSGGIYFWAKRKEANHHTLRQRIFQEALLSLRLAEQLIEKFKQKGMIDFNLTIHVDVGPNGETKKMLHEIVGMVVGSGFSVKVKPESYGASSVADRHT